METATPEKIGELNRKLILDYVRKNGPVSRADIHRNLGMSFPTVSSNVKKLIESRHLLEAGDGDNPIGRKSTLVRFNCRRVYVIGIDIGRSQARVMLADLDGDELAYITENAVDSRNHPGGLTLQLCDMVDRALARAEVAAAQVQCICIGIPGIRNAQTGKLMLAPFIESLDLDEICTAFKQRYGAAVLMDNSVNYGAIGEKWQGVVQGYRNIVYINYGVGLGAALILNGELYKGMNDAAGEIGFMLPGMEWARSAFEEEGVLESLVSGEQIRRWLAGLGVHADLRYALEKFRAGEDPYADRIRRIVDTIGMVLVNITSVFNEEIIVIGGGLGDLLGELFIPEWTRMLKAHVPFVPKIVCSGLKQKANILGAVAVAVRHAGDADI